MKKAMIIVAALMVFLSSTAVAGEKKAALGPCVRDCVQRYNPSLADSGADEFVIDGFSAEWCVQFCKEGIHEGSCYPFQDGCCNTSYQVTDPDCQVVKLQLGEACDAGHDLCVEGLACIPDVEGQTAGLCGYPVPNDWYCNADNQCLSGDCVKLNLLAGYPCTLNTQCAGNSTCDIFPEETSGACAGGSGESLDGTCQGGALGSPCTVNEQCNEGACEIATGATSGVCSGLLLPDGATCTSNAQCSSDYSRPWYYDPTGLCGDVDPVTHFGECMEGNLPSGSVCDFNAQCQTGVCNIGLGEISGCCA